MHQLLSLLFFKPDNETWKPGICGMYFFRKLSNRPRNSTHIDLSNKTTTFHCCKPSLFTATSASIIIPV